MQTFTHNPTLSTHISFVSESLNHSGDEAEKPGRGGSDGGGGNGGGSVKRGRRRLKDI